MPSLFNGLSPTQWKRATAIRERLEKLKKELSDIGGEVAASVQAPVRGVVRKKRVLSPEIRAGIAATQKARWAERPGSYLSKAVAKSPSKPKKALGRAVRAKISAGDKARWAKDSTAKKRT